MALQPWIGRSAGQLDADSPLDVTLHNSYDDDLIHLKQVLYGDGAGGYLTPIDGHDHDDANSAIITVNSLKFSTGSWDLSIGALSYGSVEIVEYSHWPKIKGSVDIQLFGGGAGPPLSGTYLHRVWAYNSNGSLSKDWQGEYRYHSASEQIIEILKDLSGNILGVHVTEKGNENSIGLFNKDGMPIPTTNEILTVDTNPSLFISEKDKRCKLNAQSLDKNKLKLKYL